MVGHRSSEIHIDSVTPSAAIPGGSLEVCGSGMLGADCQQPEVRFGEVAGRIVVGSPNRLLVHIPEDASEGRFVITCNGASSAPIRFTLGRQLTDSVHPVTNPAVDEQGNVYTTLSGSRGKKTPVSVYRVQPEGQLAALASDIVNPTGLLLRTDGTLLVTSRHNGTVYSISPDGELEIFAEGMGVATGLAIDSSENVYVGDRTGTIFKISPQRKIYVFATLESSVAAYHMAVGEDGNLFVSAPTTSSYDPIHRIDREGAVSVWRRGFGRPQGIAFDPLQRLYLCTSYRGRRGVFRLGDGDAVEQVVSGQGIVGLAFEPSGGLVLATGNSIFRVPQLQ